MEFLSRVRIPDGGCNCEGRRMVFELGQIRVSDGGPGRSRFEPAAGQHRVHETGVFVPWDGQTRLGRLDDEHRAGGPVRDGVRHAAEHAATHALVANHEHVRPALRREAHEDVGRIALVDE
jgi:hypothetical protein